MVLQFLVQDHSLFGICLVLALTILYQWQQQRRLPKDIDTIGASANPLSKYLAKFRCLFHGRAFLEEAYYKYSKANQPCVLPGIFGSQIVLPPSMVPWLISQPEHILSAKFAQIDAIEGTHTMLQPEVVLQPVHEPIIRRDLKNRLNDLIPDMADEIATAVDEIWGKEKHSFRRVNLDHTVREIVTRVSNRAFVGLPLCRNPIFTENAIKYVDSLPMNALFLKLFPGPFRSFIAKITTLGTRLFYSRCAPLLERFFVDRISAWHRDPTGMRDNYADWSVCDAMKRDNAVEKTPGRLSRRLMTLNFAAIHTSTMTTANMIIDMASGPSGRSCVDAILAECQALSDQYGDDWSSARIAEMVVTDSALRESMRLSGFGSKGFTRKVIPLDGVALPAGSRISPGEILCISAYSMHHDEAIYPRPHEFCYDRFLEPPATGDESETETRGVSKAAATTDVNYAVWGHGKHACPGRFFAVSLMKMMVAYMIQCYEFEAWDERPANVWIGDTPIPPRELDVGVRRRD